MQYYQSREALLPGTSYSEVLIVARREAKRLKFYAAAIDLIGHTRLKPVTVHQGADRDVRLHRFYGLTSGGQKFCVQIKQNLHTGRKDFISVYDLR